MDATGSPLTKFVTALFTEAWFRSCAGAVFIQNLHVSPSGYIFTALKKEPIHAPSLCTSSFFGPQQIVNSGWLKLQEYAPLRCIC